MLDNKKDKINKIHHIVIRFKKLIQDLGLSENELRDIANMAMTGKIELKKSAKQYSEFYDGDLD